MIISISKELGKIEIPSEEGIGELKMVPFDLATLQGVPGKYTKLVLAMVEHLPKREGIGYLTLDGRTVQEGTTQRRGGAHIDGNYIPEDRSGGWSSAGQGGWKVGEGGRELSSENHKLSYESKTGGMLIASTYPACKGWNGEFDGNPGIGGDCTHIELNEGFMLKPNHLYYGNSQFVHESLPLDKTVHRTIVRITLPIDYPILN